MVVAPPAVDRRVRRPRLGLVRRRGRPDRHRRRWCASPRPGLGCPTWPECTADSFVSHARDGHPRRHRVRQPPAHLRARRSWPSRCSSPSSGCAATRPELFWLAFAQGVSDPRPGRHRRHQRPDEPEPLRRRAALRRLDRAGRADRRRWCTASCAGPGHHAARSSRLVHRRRPRHGRRRRSSPSLVGILTTGSGPHAGRRGRRRRTPAPQRASTPRCMEHVHSWPGLRDSSR